MKRALAAAVSVAVVVAGPHAQTRAVKALVGGTLIDGFAGPAIRNSVILIDGERVSAVGQVGQLAVPPRGGKGCRKTSRTTSANRSSIPIGSRTSS
jgi:hypothetical protein